MCFHVVIWNPVSRRRRTISGVPISTRIRYWLGRELEEYSTKITYSYLLSSTKFHSLYVSNPIMLQTLYNILHLSRPRRNPMIKSELRYGASSRRLRAIESRIVPGRFGLAYYQEVLWIYNKIYGSPDVPEPCSKRLRVHVWRPLMLWSAFEPHKKAGNQNQTREIEAILDDSHD